MPMVFKTKKLHILHLQMTYTLNFHYIFLNISMFSCCLFPIIKFTITLSNMGIESYFIAEKTGEMSIRMCCTKLSNFAFCLGESDIYT